MEYLVLMKHVPKFAKVQLDPVTNNLIREGLKMMINPADLNALTLALKLKQQTGGSVSVLSMGSEAAIAMIKEAIAMGADKGYLLSAPVFRGSDTLATSYALSSTIKYIGGIDVVISGTQTIDGDTGQVGPEVAEWLGINQATYVKDANYKDGAFEVVRQLDKTVEKVKVNTPVLLSVFRDANEVKKVSREKIESISDNMVNIITDVDVSMDVEKIGAEGSPTVVKEVFAPINRPTGMILEGDTDEKIDKLIELLLADGIVGR